MKASTLAARLCVCVALVFGAAPPAFAQDVAKPSVGIGYATVRADPNPCTGCTWNWYRFGFNIDGSMPINERLQAIGEFGWARHPFREDPAQSVGGLNALNAGGGLRWSVPGRFFFEPFAQLVAGLHRDSFDGATGPGRLTFIGSGIPANSFMVQPGGGVVVPVSPELGIVGQIDYRRVFADTAIDTVRFVVGIRVSRR